MKSFIDLLKKELKLNMGFGILATVYIFFARFLTYFAILSEGIERAAEDSLYATPPGLIAKSYLGTGNFFHPAVVITVAGLFGLLFIHYLHVRKTVDFYHGMPFKKTTVFGVKFLCGIILFMLAYFINLAIMLIVTAYTGLLTLSLIGTAVMTFINGVLGFCLIYSVTMLAGLLTATVMTHIVLAGIFTFIIPLVIGLTEAWFERFFVTYYSTWELDKYIKTSPVAYFTSTCNKNSPSQLLALLTASAVFTAICFIVCKIRKSEAVEISLSFERTVTPLRIFFSVVLGVMGGFVFESMFWHASGNITFTVGMFIIGLVSSVIIQIIFRLDFTAAFKNKKCLLITTVIFAVMLIASFGSAKSYNTYVLSQDKIASAAISILNIQNVEEYRMPIENDEWATNNLSDYNGETTYKLATDTEGLMLDNMNITDSALVNEFLTNITEDYKDGTYDKPYEDASSGDSHTFVSVKVTPKRGRPYYRNYKTDITKHEDVFKKLIASPEYKQGLWPNVYNMDPGEIKCIHVNNNFTFHKDEIFNTDEDLAKRLTEALKKDYDNITPEELLYDDPIAFLLYYNKASDKADDGSGYALPSDSYNSGNVYIYPSFTNSIAVLKELGFKEYTDEEIIANIKHIEISQAKNGFYTDNDYTDKNEIAEIYPCLSWNMQRKPFKNYLSDYLYVDVDSNDGWSSSDTGNRTGTMFGIYIENGPETPDFLKAKANELAEDNETE